MSNLAARQPDHSSDRPVLPGTLKRGDVEGLLVDLRSTLGLSPARLDVLLAMIRRTRPSDWTDPGVDAVCFVQQQQLALDLGKTARALRYDEAALLRLGFIARETIGNGRRCAPLASAPEKYGLSFAPLIRQVAHLLDLRDLVQRESARLRALRLSCLALRQQFRLVLSELRQADPDGSKWALLRKSRVGRGSPFPGQTYPTASVTVKTLNGLTPYEYICKIWTSEPERFIIDPIHQMPGLNTLCVSGLLH